MWMVIRVHYGTTNCRSDTHVTFTSGFTDVNKVVISVSDYTNSCAAYDRNHSHLTGRKTKCCVLSFFSHELCAVSCRTNHLSAFSRMKLNVVNHSTNRDKLQWEAVSNTNLSFRTIVNLLAYFKSLWSEDVSFLAICVADQSDVSCSVRIVLDTDYCSRDSIFSSLEVDDSVFSSASATLMSYSDFTLIVTSGVLLKGSNEGFLWFCSCNLREVGTSHMSS